MRQYVNSVLRRLWWFAAIPTIWHISLVSSLVIRQSQPSTNNTVSPEVLTAGQELQNCASAVMIPVLQFVITNYIAHAFTVRFSPGYGKFYTIIFSLKALVFPCFGLLTACRAMENRTRKEDPLIHALKAGALCTIARTEEWKPENGDIIWLPQRTEKSTAETQTSASGATSTKQDNGDEIATSDTPKLTAMYCKEEGLEGLQQCYINVHGLCRLPRTHVLGSESEDGKCNSCKHPQHAACPEEAPSTKLLHCQKGQYMLVRLPPHCKVRWKGRERFHNDLRRFHSPENSGFIEILKKLCFGFIFLKKCFPSKNTANQSGGPAGSGGGNVPEASGSDVSPQKPTNADDKRVDGHTVGSADASQSCSGETPHLANNDLGIAGSQSLIKSFIALVQLFSIIQILRADKVHDYGAYQLTLIPYALMSLVNIVSGFLAPSYPAVYMVESTVMREARKRGGVFDGVVGLLDEDEEEKTMTKMIADGRELDLPTESKTGRWKRQKRTYSLISFGDFYAENNDVFRMGGYFHHLARSLPLLRVLKDPFLLERFRANNFHRLTSGGSSDKSNYEKKREDKIMSSQSIFQALFDMKAPEGSAVNYLAVLEIGNARHTPAVRSFMAFLMDVVIIVALAIPYITIHALTGFNAPSSSERVHGIVFMLWLTIGEVLPFLLIPSWNLINLQFWRVKLNWRILEGFLSTSVFTGAALAGFYFVGEMRYQDLVQQNTNCTAARNNLAGLNRNGSIFTG